MVEPGESGARGIVSNVHGLMPQRSTTREHQTVLINSREIKCSLPVGGLNMLEQARHSGKGSIKDIVPSKDDAQSATRVQRHTSRISKRGLRCSISITVRFALTSS